MALLSYIANQPPGHKTQDADFQEKCEKSSQNYRKNVISRAKTGGKM